MSSGPIHQPQIIKEARLQGENSKVYFSILLQFTKLYIYISSGQPQRPFQCNHCQKNFPKKADRDRHEFSVHREKMRTPRGLIDCPEKGCPRRDMKGFTRKDNLLDHRRRVHNRNIPKRNHALGGRSVRR